MTQNFSEVEDPYLPPAKTKWPAVLGWILFAWSILGVCMTIFGIFNKSLSNETYQGLPDWMVAAIRVLFVCGSALSLVGLGGGWFLRQRLRRGYSLTKIWVILSLILTTASLSIQIIGRDDMQLLIKRKTLEAMDKGGQPTDKMTPEVFKTIWLAQVGCGGVLGYVPPIVFGALLMANRRRIEVSTWPR